MKIAYLSTWPPRECGIATFTQDLAYAVEKVDSSISWEVLALNEPGTKYNYDKKVALVINRENYKDYKKAVDYINKSGINAVVLQHEFNLYEPKSYLFKLLYLMKKPIITVLHTVFFPEIYKTPKLKSRTKALKKIIEKSTLLITMCKIGASKIRKDYNLPKDRIFAVYHGAPKIKRVNQVEIKKKLGLSKKELILSYGLIGRGKNLEQVILAMPSIIKKFPNAVYCVLGKTHPRLPKTYHNFLKDLVKKLNLTKNVYFVDHYLSFQEITDWLSAADIFVNTSRILNQVSSGTLTYALTAGKCIIATPFIYAKDVLSRRRGVIVPVDDYEALAKKVIELLSNLKKRKEYEKRAYEFGQRLLWPNIAKEYIKIFKKAINQK